MFRNHLDNVYLPRRKMVQWAWVLDTNFVSRIHMYIRGTNLLI